MFCTIFNVFLCVVIAFEAYSPFTVTEIIYFMVFKIAAAAILNIGL